MCLSSLNRSIYAAFRHILPYSAPLCKALHYSKTGVPWQMKSIFIIVLFLLVLPGNALFCEGFRRVVVCSEITECGNSEQDLVNYYYLLVVKLVVKENFLLLRKNWAQSFILAPTLLNIIPIHILDVLSKV